MAMRSMSDSSTMHIRKSITSANLCNYENLFLDGHQQLNQVACLVLVCFVLLHESFHLQTSPGHELVKKNFKFF
jgi:hypothetical protein